MLHDITANDLRFGEIFRAFAKYNGISKVAESDGASQKIWVLNFLNGGAATYNGNLCKA